MATKKRKAALSRYHHLYHHIDNDGVCIYCGDVADVDDHVPPITRVDDYRAFGLNQEYYLVVPCCSHCNGLLGSSLQRTLLERIYVLNDKLRDRLRKDGADWTPEQLDELGGWLHEYISSGIEHHSHLRNRFNYSCDWSAIAMQLENIYGD